jgi:hypothetical protein
LDCTLHDCNSAFEDDKYYDSATCQDVSYLTFDVPSAANYLTVQLQNNDFNGNKDCGYDDIDCCGGSYSSCASGTGVCEQVIELSTCPSTYIPAPECETDYDCAYLTQDCTEGVCSYGSCVTVYTGSHYECRPAVGDCDEPEYCSGYDSFCPEDKKRGYDYECRSKVSDCDFAETCNGYSDDCPEDTWESEGIECRPAHSSCDVPEFCTGYSGECPEDNRSDYAYTFKCGLTQFLCGVKRDELSTNNGGSFFLGSCGIGTARDFVDLAYPECLGECLYSKCPNNKGLSNWAEAHCDSNGGWVCDKKQDVGSSTLLPYCFPNFN